MESDARLYKNKNKLESFFIAGLHRLSSWGLGNIGRKIREYLKLHWLQDPVLFSLSEASRFGWLILRMLTVNTLMML